MDRIPIVDLNGIGKMFEDITWKSVANDIRKGLGNVGFVYLKNHGIDKRLITETFTEMQKFFDLSRDVKLKYKKQTLNGDFSAWCGYSEPGEELLHPTSIKELRETYDILQGMGVYPDSELPEFSKAFSSMYEACNALAKKLIILFAIPLDLDRNFFLNRCTHIDNMSMPRSGNMRALYYPPIPNDMNVEPDMIGGLEVQTLDGTWIPATPIPDTILVNTGDLLEFWTGGIYPATKHRVIIPEDPKQKLAARYSVAYFLAPNVDTEVKSLKIAKTTSKERRLAVSSSRQNYDELNSVKSMDYILDRLSKSYGQSK